MPGFQKLFLSVPTNYICEKFDIPVSFSRQSCKSDNPEYALSQYIDNRIQIILQIS